MSQKVIKIPSGQIKVLFEKNAQSFEITDKMLWDALCEFVFKGDEPKPQKQRPDFDDEHPDYIKGSQEEI